MKITLLSLTLLLCCGTNINAMSFENKLVLKRMCKEINTTEFAKKQKTPNTSCRHMIKPINMGKFDVCSRNLEDVEYDWNNVLSNELVHNMQFSRTSNGSDNTNFITLLIKNRVNPTKLFKYGIDTTNFHYALSFSKPKIVDILLQCKNIKLDVKDGSGKPIIFELITRDIIDSNGNKIGNDKVELLKKLIQCGSNTNITNALGNNFLMQLLSSDFIDSSLDTDGFEIVNFLISSTKLNIDKQNKTGQNVFHILAKQGTKEQRNDYTHINSIIPTNYTIHFGTTHHRKTIEDIVFLLRKTNAKLLEKTDYQENTPLDIALNKSFSTIYNISRYDSPVIPSCTPVKFLCLFIPSEQEIAEFKNTFSKLQSYYLNHLKEAFSTMQNYNSKESRERNAEIVTVCEQDLAKYLKNKITELENKGQFDKALYLNSQLIKLNKKIHLAKKL